MRSEERRLQELRKRQQYQKPRPKTFEDMGLPTPSMRRDVMVRVLAISVPVLYVINPVILPTTAPLDEQRAEVEIYQAARNQLP